MVLRKIHWKHEVWSQWRTIFNNPLSVSHSFAIYLNSTELFRMRSTNLFVPFELLDTYFKVQVDKKQRILSNKPQIFSLRLPCSGRQLLLYYLLITVLIFFGCSYTELTLTELGLNILLKGLVDVKWLWSRLRNFLPSLVLTFLLNRGLNQIIYLVLFFLWLAGGVCVFRLGGIRYRSGNHCV